MRGGGRRREETLTALDGKTAGRRQEGGLDASVENARPIRGGMERGRRARALSGLRETEGSRDGRLKSNGNETETAGKIPGNLQL